jgi:hypothetical protein
MSSSFASLRLGDFALKKERQLQNPSILGVLWHCEVCGVKNLTKALILMLAWIAAVLAEQPVRAHAPTD